MSSSYPQRKSWKQSSAKPGRQPESKTLSRWILTTVTVLMLGCLLYLLIQLFIQQPPRTQFVAVLTGESRQLTVPSQLLSERDLLSLKQLPERWRDIQYSDQSELQELGNISQLGAELGKLQVGPKDCLIVYVSAHGVCNLTAERSADLLCREYDLTSPKQAVYSVATLLNEVRKSDARTKLVILDSGSIVSDARLGQFVNAFPRLLAETVRDTQDPNLWVLHSHGLLEPNMSLAGQRKTLFGRAVVDGLMGKADLPEYQGNQDKYVSLDELYRYVALRCGIESDGQQTPILLPAGTAGPSTEIPQERLVTVFSLVDEAAAKQEEATAAASDETAKVETVNAETAQAATDAKKPPANNQENAVSASGSGPEGQAAATTTSATAIGSATASTPNVDGATTTASVETQPPALLDQIDLSWQLRDQLQTANQVDRWLPLEYAPHVWRELTYILIEAEMRYLDADESQQQELARSVGGRLNALRALADGREGDMEGNRALAEYRLREAARRFNADQSVRTSFLPDDPGLRQVANDIRVVQRILYLLPDYLKWYGSASFTANDADEQLDEIGRHLTNLIKSLKRFQDTTNSFSGRQLAENTIAELAGQQSQVREAHEQLVELLNSRINQSIKEPANPWYAQRAASFLWSAIPTAAQRKALREAWLQFNPQAPASFNATHNIAPVISEISATKSRRVRQQFALQVSVAALVGDSAGQLGSIPEVGEVLDHTPGAAARLLAYYRGLPEEFANAPSPDLLIQVDPRDADAQQLQGWTAQWVPTLRILPPYKAPELRLAYSVQEFELSERSKDEINVRFTVEGEPSARKLSVDVIYNEAVIELLKSDGLDAEKVELPINNGTAELRLTARVRPGYRLDDTDPRRDMDYPIHFQARAGALRLDTRRAGGEPIRATLPRPDVVSLIVERENSKGPASAMRHGTELRVFPNRTTNFILKMRNRSSQQKTVKASLYSVPATVIDQPPGRLLTEKGVPYELLQRSVFGNGPEQPPTIAPLAEGKSAVLSPASDAVPIDFSNSPTAAPAAPNPAETAPTPAPAAPPTGETPIPHGLVCVLSDGELQHVYWLELRPASPRDYLEVQVGHQGNDQLTITGGLKSDAPPATSPIKLSLDTYWLPSTVDVTGGAILDEITPEKRKAALSVKVTGDRPRGIARIRIDADGWPRAFAYDVDLDRPTAIAPKRDALSLRITEVSVTDGQKSYLTHGYEPPAAKEPAAIALGSNDVAAFRKPSAQTRLSIGLQVDAPYDTFLRGHAGDYVELSLQSRDLPPRVIRRLFADRAMKFKLAATGAAGLLGIQTKLGDYDGEQGLTYGIGGLSGRYDLTATLVINNETRASSSVALTFDDSPPTFTYSVSPRSVETGGELQLNLTGEDISGIASAGYAILDNRDAKVDKFTPLVLPLNVDAGDDINLRAKLPLQDLKPAQPTVYVLRVKLADRLGLEQSKDVEFRVYPKKAPAQAGDDQRIAYRGTVAGYVFTANARPARFKVTLTGGEPFPEFVTATGGEFKFENVPLGKYEIKTEGILSGAFRKTGSLEIELKKPEDYRRFAVPLQDVKPDK